jgi:hypothetical protein
VGQPVTIVGQPVTVFGQPVTIMGQPVTIQGQNQYVTVTNAAQGTQQQQMQYTPTSSGNSMPVAGRYYRDVYQNCMDGLTQQIVPSNYCGSRRSRHSIGQTVPGSSSQVPFVGMACARLAATAQRPLSRSLPVAGLPADYGA